MIKLHLYRFLIYGCTFKPYFAEDTEISKELEQTEDERLEAAYALLRDADPEPSKENCFV